MKKHYSLACLVRLVLQLKFNGIDIIIIIMNYYLVKRKATATASAAKCGTTALASFIASSLLMPGSGPSPVPLCGRIRIDRRPAARERTRPRRTGRRGGKTNSCKTIKQIIAAREIGTSASHRIGAARWPLWLKAKAAKQLETGKHRQNRNDKKRKCIRAQRRTAGQSGTAEARETRRCRFV